MTDEQETLGRFGYHPDHAIDFCCEVEVIDGKVFELFARTDRLMSFVVGGDPLCVKAKARVRRLHDALAAYKREVEQQL